MPFFSIIVPVYNTEKYLNQCVNSVLHQSFSDFELILVDDGSTDNSPVICDEYAKTDARIKVIHKENGGVSSARNVGLDYAKGKYVLFIDSDDYYNDNNGLEKIYTKLTLNEVDVLIIGEKKYLQRKDVYVNVKISDIPNGLDKLKYLMSNNSFVASAWDKVYLREFIERNGLRFVLGQKSEDIEWCIKLLEANPKIDVLAENIYVYRKQVSSSITANIKRKNVEDIFNVIVKYSNLDNLYIKQFLAVQYVQLIAITNLVESKQIKDILTELRRYFGLLRYCWYPYVRKVRALRFFGFHVVRKLLGLKLYGIMGCKR